MCFRLHWLSVINFDHSVPVITANSVGERIVTQNLDRSAGAYVKRL